MYHLRGAVRGEGESTRARQNGSSIPVSSLRENILSRSQPEKAYAEPCGHQSASLHLVRQEILDPASPSEPYDRAQDQEPLSLLVVRQEISNQRCFAVARQHARLVHSVCEGRPATEYNIKSIRQNRGRREGLSGIQRWATFGL